jgi:hypothetical protein
MKSYLGPFDLLLWYTVIILEFALFGLLIRSRSRYRAFTSYIAFCCARSAILFVVALTPSEEAYFYIFWLGSAVESVLVFLVAHEIFERMFAPYATLPKNVIPVFCTAVLVMTTGAAVIATSARSLPDMQGSHHLIYGLLTTERVTTVLLGSVFALIVIFATTFGLPWGSHALGISMGLGLSFVVQATVTALESSLPTPAGEISRAARSLAFISAEVLWIKHFLKPEPAPIELTPEKLAVFRKIAYQFINKRRQF